MLTNRLSTLNGKIPPAWLNNSIDSFKIKWKELLLYIETNTKLMRILRKYTRTAYTIKIEVSDRRRCIEHRKFRISFNGRLLYSKVFESYTIIVKRDIRDYSTRFAIV